jgi:replicative DNA helicase
MVPSGEEGVHGAGWHRVKGGGWPERGAAPVSVAEIAPRGDGFERTPPHDVAAEQCVLGGMMLSKDAIADVLDVIKAHDYYRPAHQIIHDVILDLYGRGEPADAVTVAAELTRNGDIGRMGGAPYLHTLIASVPTAANAGYYARIVRERAVLRRLVEVGTRIVQLGYAGDGDADELVDRAEAEIYGVTDRRVSEDYLPLAAIMPGALDEIEAIGSRGASLAGVPTGFADLDALTNGLHPGQMVVIAARPAMGKSALALDIARAASVQAGLTAVLFSLEMSRNEITMRLLSAEARVPLQAMRTGQLGEDDWTRLARRMSEVVDAPLYIDDSPNMSMMEIRSKCRRLKQRHDLKLVVIDYLQLMSSPKRVENRQQEVSDLSRSLKLLAKELNVPVVALAQLNRGPEMRTDKRPLLADLRESGCLTASTRITRADTDEEVSLGELLASGARDIPVWALDERLKYVKGTMSHVFPTGRKEVYALRLASGRQIEATANHRFLTIDGWMPLAELGVGSRIAVPRRVPAPLAPEQWPSDRVVLLAHLLGDGSAPDQLTRGRRNPIASWLDELGPFGLRSHEKFVPSDVFRLPDAQVALFLRHLWATDGSVTVARHGRGGCIYYGSTSRRLLDDVAGLLRRFGINPRIRQVMTGPHRPQFTLDIFGRDDQLSFLTKIGVHGARATACEQLKTIIEGTAGNTNVDTIPAEIWQRVRRTLAEQGTSHRQFSAAIGTQFCPSTPWQRSPSRGRLAMVAEVLNDAELDLLATNDVLWDEIAVIEPQGAQDVYDATVLGLHNFVANGIAVHNSIEQDADVVILLHREDAYERESPRAGEADLIVAKHRNGPTTTVTVAFQGHYSRFVDMAPI